MTRRSPAGPGGTPATVALEQAGISHTRHTYAHDPRVVADGGSYGLEAADALGLAPETVFKTLLVALDGAPRPGLGVAVVPVTHRLDLKAVAAALGVKRVSMAEPRVAERTTGYVVGGISPVGQRVGLPTVVDSSAAAHPAVFVSGGRRGFDIGLAPADLVRITSAVLAPVAR
ncbi:Cys-tRNA(Pro) deacylase [Aquipuribacter sp. MA13-6]|uniref:Cys-tRNA(Pro) deacylase n=1 Tax=unclassified Aquipuribacter TaxID=2635084 RepID=UPI003EEA50DE